MRDCVCPLIHSEGRLRPRLVSPKSYILPARL